MMLSGTFISFYTLHYHFLFRKEIYFFECLYFSEYNIQMSLYVFGRERVRQFSTYATSGEMDGCRGETSGPGHAKCVKLRTMGGGVMPHVYIRIYISFTSHTHLFSCFWQHFFVFIVED